MDAETVVSALNQLIDDASSGRTLFYDFYTAHEKAEQPARSNTGLFFLRGRPGAPFAIIAPGGGFSYVASLHEGFPYAVAIRKHGLNAFVLKYRVGSGGGPATRDLAAAISHVFRNAKALGVGHRGVFPVGQFGWRTNGGRDRLARHRELWWRRPPRAGSRADGLYRPLGGRAQRAADVRRRRRARWNRSSI